jgi:hypothetical protein
MIKAIWTLPSTFHVHGNVFEHYTTTVTIYKRKTFEYLKNKVFERAPIEIIGELNSLEK